MLCGSGCATYEVKEGSPLTKEFILSDCCPGITSFLGPGPAFVLGKALVFAAFIDFQQSAALARVRESCARIDIHENPIERVQVVLSGEDGTVRCDRVDAGPLAGAGRALTLQVQGVRSAIADVQDSINRLSQQVGSDNSKIFKKFDRILANTAKLGQSSSLVAAAQEVSAVF